MAQHAVPSASAMLRHRQHLATRSAPQLLTNYRVKTLLNRLNWHMRHKPFARAAQLAERCHAFRARTQQPNFQSKRRCHHMASTVRHVAHSETVRNGIGEESHQPGGLEVIIDRMSPRVRCIWDRQGRRVQVISSHPRCIPDQQCSD